MLLTTKGGNAGKVHIYIDGEYRLTVDGSFWQSCGITEKTQLEEEQVDVLTERIRLRQAFNKGAKLLELREHSKQEIIEKLKQKGFSDCAEQAALQLTECGYLSEERFCEVYIRQLSEKKQYGRERILLELRKKGISRETAQQCYDRLLMSEQLETDVTQRILSLLEGKLRAQMTDEKGMRRCKNTLIRWGYGLSDINRAFAALKEMEQ